MQESTNIGYKLLRQKNGRLYPLYVFASEETPTLTWLDAKDGPRALSGKVQSKLGELAFRPGWHITDIPYVEHIYSVHGAKRYLKDDCVWCEVEYSTEVDYSNEARDAGWKNQRWSAVRAYLNHVPVNGFYRYKTSPQMFGEWIIAGSMKILRVLNDEEVEAICSRHGLNPLKRYSQAPSR